MVKKVLAHFRARDSRIYPLIKLHTHSLIVPRPEAEHFESLCREIIGQQLSGRVADVIFSRFNALTGVGLVTPERILSLSDTALRATGLSGAKVRYVRALAHEVRNGTLLLAGLPKLPDAEVVRQLTRITGIGPWTAEMYLMFTLGRQDVFSYGDLGLRRAIQMLYTFRTEPTRTQMERIVKRWVPYRTYAALALWKFKDS